MKDTHWAEASSELVVKRSDRTWKLIWPLA